MAASADSGTSDDVVQQTEQNADAAFATKLPFHHADYDVADDAHLADADGQG